MYVETASKFLLTWISSQISLFLIIPIAIYQIFDSVADISNSRSVDLLLSELRGLMMIVNVKNCRMTHKMAPDYGENT